MIYRYKTKYKYIHIDILITGFVSEKRDVTNDS